MNALSALSPTALAVLRVVTGLLFTEHGTQKIFSLPDGRHAGAEIASIEGVAGLLELVGGPLIVFGLFTRPVAFVLCGFMAVAYWMAHAPGGFFPINNGGDAAILYCFVFGYLVFAGPGRFALDNALARSKVA